MVRLLGALEVEGPGGVVSPAGLRPKEQRVLARLALEPGRMVPRDELLDLFWPDSAAGAAERSLRTVVSSLRGSLRSVLNGHELRLITGRLDGYCLEPAAIAVDAARFADAIRSARTALQREAALARVAPDGGRRGGLATGVRHPVSAEALAACREAVDLYRGDLLSAFPYDDWCLAMRERMRDDYLDALFQLARAALADGSLEAARGLGSRMVEVDSTEERAHRLLMRCYARLGRPADALRQFARCRAALHDELGARPSPATLALLETIRAGAAPADEESESPRRDGRRDV
jgi:DNA-binding SARP family transcriptional activator